MTGIEIKGLGKLTARLGAYKARDSLRPVMTRSVERLRARLAKYPSARPGSGYIRTGTLGRRWTTRITMQGSNQYAGRIVGIVGNNTIYAPYVQSQAKQARWHKGRWQTEVQVANEERAAIVADFEQEIGRLLRG